MLVNWPKKGAKSVWSWCQFLSSQPANTRMFIPHPTPPHPLGKVCPTTLCKYCHRPFYRRCGSETPQGGGPYCWKILISPYIRCIYRSHAAVEAMQSPLGSSRDQKGMKIGPFLGDFGPFLGRSAVILGSLGGSFWHRFGVIFSPIWCVRSFGRPF